jgi:uncharacterized protein with FMN-binding domain/ferredoxin
LYNNQNKTEKLRLIAQFTVFLLVIISLLLYRLYINGTINFKLISINGLSPFGGLNMIYDWLLTPSYHPGYNSPALLLAAAIIVSALIAGRFFCGWVCPFGALNDYLNLAGKKIFGKNYELPLKIDASLRYLKYLILIVIIVSQLLLDSCFLKDFGPWVAFVNLPGLPAAFEEMPYAFMVLGLVGIGSIFISRFYCRYLCPVGAIQAILAGAGITQLKKWDTALSCKSCRVCSFNCPVRLRPGESAVVSSPECINCLRCTGESCPMGSSALGVEIHGKRTGNITYTLAAYVIFLGIYVGVGFNNFIPNNHTMATGLMPHDTYLDGVYYGTGVGFAPGIMVQVEIREGRIDKIIIIKHNETSGYYEEVFKEVSGQIIEKQTIAVDAVSGATYSSRGLAEAVKDALNKAKPKK